MLQAIANRIGVTEPRFDPRWTLPALAGIAVIVALLVAFYLWRDNASFYPLHGAGESFPAAEVMGVLDAERIRYRVHPRSGQILVREDQLARARIQLSAHGVEVAVPAGYELFDHDTPLGSSQFVQNVRLKRSLEGELARTVMALRSVDYARVHLAQEDTNTFAIGNRNPPKASVMVQLRQGQSLSSDQVSAISNLVANSIPGLEPESVTVVDQYGTLLSRSTDPWSGSAQTRGIVTEYREQAVANIEEVLAPIVGRGNYRVSVAAEFDFSQREETSHVFGEEGRVRNEILSNETVTGQLALGVPGSLANLPVPPPADLEDDESAPGPTAVNEQANRRLDYDQTITHVRHAPYTLQQQSISVVLNAQSAPEGGWTEELRAELEATIRGAVAFQEMRGDVLTLNVFPFAPVETVTPEELEWWMDPGLHSLVRFVLAGLFALIVLWMVTRTLRTLLTSRGADEYGDGEEGYAEQLTGAEPASLAQRAESLPQPRPVFSELNPLAEIPLPDPGSGLELQIEHLRMLAEKEPERVSEIIKRWVGRNERDGKSV